MGLMLRKNIPKPVLPVISINRSSGPWRIIGGWPLSHTVIYQIVGTRGPQLQGTTGTLSVA